MQFDGALIREQGITFAVVVVKKHVVENVNEARLAIRNFSPAFPGVPVILMGQGHSGSAAFFGRKDIAQFLSRISLSRIPWKRYTV